MAVAPFLCKYYSTPEIHSTEKDCADNYICRTIDYLLIVSISR